MFKKQEGITLVALVITIIVLLILAGVSISLVIGDNGVLTQASTAVVEDKIANAREALNMALASTETIYYGQWVADSSTTRADVYGEASEPDETNLNTLYQQLSNLGYELVTTINITDETDSDNPLTIVSNGTNETFKFENVWVDENTGKATLGGSISIYSADANIDDDAPLYTLPLDN